MDKILQIETSSKDSILQVHEEDPKLTQFLSLLMENNSSHIHAINSALLERVQSLVLNVEVDLEAPLSDKMNSFGKI